MKDAYKGHEVVKGANLKIKNPPNRTGTSSFDLTSGKSWGIEKVKAPAVWGTTKGAGVTIAVIDTGVDSDHPELDGRVTLGACFVSGEALSEDENGHGTHVAGTVAGSDSGIAPDAEILAVRVLDASGRGNESSVIAGILHAVEQGVDVINLSLRTQLDDSINGRGTRMDQLYRDAIDSAKAAGIVVVAAAGNDGASEPIGQPGRQRGVITVAALDQGNFRASFSQTGNLNSGKPDIGAPGVNILSAALGGGTSILSGTSMATPHVAGICALMLAADDGKELKGNRHEAARRALTETADTLSESATSVGAGLVDAVDAVRAYANITNLVPIERPTLEPGSDVDLVKIRKHHKEQMKLLAAIGTDLEENLKRLQEFDKDPEYEKPAEGEKPELNPDGTQPDSFDKPGIDQLLDEEQGKVETKNGDREKPDGEDYVTKTEFNAKFADL
mgnify:CR=1 FL=1